MPVTTQHDLQRERILAACRLAAVASAAGVASGPWASTTSPRVVASDAAGYLGGLHRGRLPMVEVIHGDESWDRQAIPGGTINATWILRVHVPGPSWAAADSLARGIGQVCLAAIRSDEYLREGEESIGTLQADPLGFRLDVSLTLAHTYDRTTYETDATITPGSPVVVEQGPGGTTYLVAWNTVSPVDFWTLPEGNSLDNVEVEVLEAWDGVGATLQVGTLADPAQFMAAADVDLTTPATYERDHDVGGPVVMRCTFTPGTGATQGRVRIQISVTKEGT